MIVVSLKHTLFSVIHIGTAIHVHAHGYWWLARAMLR